MAAQTHTPAPRPSRAVPRRRFRSLALLALVVGPLAGCAAYRPLKGVPIEKVDHDFAMPHRNGMHTVDLSLLHQVPPAEHRVDAGDVLGIYIEGILGSPQQPLPVYQPQNPDLAPSTGYPVQVRGDGTISLPNVGPLPVRGLTIPQVEQVIHQAYTEKVKFFKPGVNGILVSLQKPRTYRVLVIRQETGNDAANQLRMQTGAFRPDKLGNGRVVSLPAYRNDVLNALAETGGLPGQDAENVIYVIRGGQTHWPAGPVVPTLPGPVLPGPPVPGPELIPQGPQPVTEPVSLRPVPSRYCDIRQVSVTEEDLDVESVRRGRAAALPPASNGLLGYTAWRGGNAPATADHRLSEALAAAERELTLPATSLDEASAVRSRSTLMRDNPPTGESRRPLAERLNDTAGRGESRNTVAPTPAEPPPTPMAMAAPVTAVPPVQPAPVPMSQPVAPPAPVVPATPVIPPAYPPLAPAPMPTAPQPLSAPVPLAPLPTPLPVTVPWGEAFAVHDPLLGPQVIRIPLRVCEGEVPLIRPEDVILYDGDIVFIESRRDEFFYTGGLLGGAQYLLPRDYDLDILGAIAIAESQTPGVSQATKALGGVSALNQDITVGASKVILFRKMPGGCELPIKIDLYRAMRHPDERVIIQPGDRIVLQYTYTEAVFAFFERQLLPGVAYGVGTAFRFSN